MLLFAASVKTRFEVLQEATSAVHVATALYAELLRLPDAPVAFVHVDAFQVTSDALYVAEPLGWVNVAAFACNEILSVLVADERTMPLAVMLTPLAAVAVLMSLTLNVTPAG